jgi:hypothetical protein
VSEAEAAAGPPGWRQVGLAWATCVAVVLAAAAVTLVVAPDWIGEDEIELPDEASLILEIFLNNLQLALLPLIGGWLAAGHRLAGRGRIAVLFVAAPALVVLRSLITVGAVGGADPDWLLDASRWWLLEVAALAIAARTGLWLARNPSLREHHGPRAMRRSVGAVVVVLAAGALIEVLTA